MTELCSRLLEVYLRNDYEESFPDLHNITPIKDPDIISALETKLLTAFQEESINLTLCIPDIVDYSTNFKVKYRGANKISKEYNDVFIGNYREYLNERQVNVDNILYFSKHSLCILDENEAIIQAFSIYKSLLFDCTYNDKTYAVTGESIYSDFAIVVKDIDEAVEILNDIFAMEGAAVACDTSVAKVSIVGAGMQSHSGTASKMFGALYEAGINISMISTSEITISVLIDKELADKAVSAVHKAFFG